MRSIFSTLAALLVLAGLTMPAEAHRLKLFATVEDGVVQGYGFFIGGGRPSEARLLIRDGSGTELFRGPAAADGSFHFKPAVPTDLTLVMDAGDGHVADAHIAASRFPPNPSLNPIGEAQAVEGPQPAVQPAAVPDNQNLAQIVDRSVDRAVSRQIEPLMEAYAQADGRARFSDIVSGIAVIIGLAGVALWGSARRRAKAQSSPPPDAS